jgi:hypothetical protein
MSVVIHQRSSLATYKNNKRLAECWWLTAESASQKSLINGWTPDSGTQALYNTISKNSQKNG